MKIIVPILNHEYRVVVCWGDQSHLRKTLIDHNYSPDIATKTYIDEQTAKRRGATFTEDRCYPVVWIDANLPFADSMGTLSHEAVHAVDSIFEAIDERMYHSEVFAHSVGAIVRESIKAMKLVDKLAKEEV